MLWTVFIFLIIHIHCVSKLKGQNPDGNKDGKLSLFNVIRFRNGPCQSQLSLTRGGFRTGICLTESECLATPGGTPSGNCALGFGVCCVVLRSCGDTVTQNCTYIQNPGFPANLNNIMPCMVTIQKCQTDICFVRLDFETFTINGPADTVETNGGMCQDTLDVMLMDGPQIPQICGQNDGQHMILDLGNNPTANAKLNFAFANTVSGPRMFDMKATQISCTDPNRPRMGCLQYFTQSSGRFESYNFQGNTNHLRNQNYNYCFRRNQGMCCLVIQACANEMNPFNIDSTSNDQIPMADSDCTQDYIIFANSGGTCPPGITRNNRYCGTKLAPPGGTENIPLCSCSPPFMVTLKTDALPEKTSDQISNRGICVMYSQVPC